MMNVSRDLRKKEGGGRKKKKQTTRVKSLPLHDELVFDMDAKEFHGNKVDISSRGENQYTMSNSGSDRLYIMSDTIVHLNPHILAWHFTFTPAEVVYASSIHPDCDIVPKIKHWWMTNDTEIVALYTKPPNVDSSLFRTKFRLQDMIPILHVFLKKCVVVFKEKAIVPTILNPQRIYFDGTRLGFFEAGHFQMLVWPVNECLRPIDATYSHPAKLMYVPTNSFRSKEQVMLESKISGLLHFFHGSVLLTNYVMTGHNPVKNCRVKPECKDGVCLSHADKCYSDFFHRFYCISALRTLPNSLKILNSHRDISDEFLNAYNEFLAAMQSDLY